MACPDRTFGMVIVGGGPAGIAPLLAAHRNGNLNDLLAEGIAIIEQGDALGGGNLGNYAINSDSTGRTFADCLIGKAETELTRLADHPMTRMMAAAGEGTVPLRDAGRFLGVVGAAVERMVAQYPTSAVLTRHSVLSAHHAADGWLVRVRTLDSGREQTLLARNLVIATGAHQPEERLADEEIGGVPLVERCGNRLLQSNDVLTEGGLERVTALLSGKTAPRVAIVGGSTSAAAVAHALLNRLPDVSFGPAGITLLHRRPLRIYYPDRASALAEGYDEWTEDDVCPISGRVFRFAGFRLDSRELIMQARGIGGRPPEPRLRLLQTGPDEREALQAVEDADLVVAAIGYRPRALPVFDRTGDRIRLMSETGPQMPMVDGRCRVLDAGGQPLENVFGIGLAAGFVPRGPLGGEPSFRGQANGLWLWQHDVGSLIVDALARPAAVVEITAAGKPQDIRIPRVKRAA